MVTVPESAFPDPLVHAAAQELVDGRGKEAILAAAAAGKIDYVGPEGDSLLTIAVLSNDIGRVQYLLDLGADPSLPNGRAPVTLAAGGAKLEIVKALLRAGADPNGTVDSQPALWRAVEGGRRDVANLLLRAGATIDQPNSNGDTPLIIATQVDEYALAISLLDAGASPFAHDKRGRTAGFWAASVDLLPQSKTGKAREGLIRALRAKGHPWPPPSGEEVLAADAKGNWPPSGSRP